MSDVDEAEQNLKRIRDAVAGKFSRNINSNHLAHSPGIDTHDAFEQAVPEEVNAVRPTSPNYSDPEVDALIASLSNEDMNVVCAASTSNNPIAISPPSVSREPSPVPAVATDRSSPVFRGGPPETSVEFARSTSGLNPPSSQSFPGSSREKKRKERSYLLLNAKNGFCGVVKEWHGLDGASNLVKGASGVVYRQYKAMDEAEQAYEACKASGLTRYLTESCYLHKWFAVAIDNTGSVCKRDNLVDTIGYHNLTIIARENIGVASTKKDANRLLRELLDSKAAV
ncbi:hypothetical protein AAF712_015779 [Marasmius tenuissimus]|uniref:Uncharacterized protein n=1 Tax=Marasmius tenuissimus TaxID=585030 RepID=A0ABR2Z7B8_9AGAR